MTIFACASELKEPSMGFHSQRAQAILLCGLSHWKEEERSKKNEGFKNQTEFKKFQSFKKWFVWNFLFNSEIVKSKHQSTVVIKRTPKIGFLTKSSSNVLVRDKNWKTKQNKTMCPILRLINLINDLLKTQL